MLNLFFKKRVFGFSKKSRLTRVLVFFAYLTFFVVVFSIFKRGAGNFWDWSIPYFRDHFRSIMIRFSWSGAVLGDPLGYASSYYFSYFIWIFSRLTPSPETTIYLMIVLVTTICTSVVFAITRRNMNRWPAFMLSLIVVFNSAFFYKLLAGHLAYIFSLMCLICLVYFLLYRFKKDLKSYLFLALLLSLVGAQIQFFVFASIFVLIYFIINRKMFSWKWSWLVLFISLLVNLPWLSNYLIGVNSVTTSSQGATVMQFSDAEFSSLKRIFFMIFSPATNIQYVYDRWELVYFGIFSLVLCAFVLFYYSKRIKDLEFRIQDSAKSKITDILVTSLVVFVLLGTGYFQKIPIPFVKTFYPMFRESGHFAPVIVLFEVLVMASVWSIIDTSKLKVRAFLKFFLLCYLLGFVVINVLTFRAYLPALDFDSVRHQFQPFEDFGKNDGSEYRVLTYPFWDQYGLNNTPNLVKNGRLLNNSGWGTFIENSKYSHISNYQPGGVSIEDTLQYRLITNYDLTELEQKNVKYIYDFSDIYTSNWNLYTSPETYKNNIALVKNDPGFMEKLMSANPGKITKISNHIYKINDFLPRIYLSSGGDKTELSFQKINPTEYKVTIKNLSHEIDLNLLENFNSGWKIYPGDYSFTDQPILDRTHTQVFGYANQWRVAKSEITGQNNKNYTVNPDGSLNVNLTIYFLPQTVFRLATQLSLMTVVTLLLYLIISVKYTNHAIESKK